MKDTYQYERRFRGAIAFYERYRLPYPERLIQRVVALAGLSPGDTVLDLGTGPGLLAIPFARAGMVVTAADPEALMLEAAAAAAQSAQVALTLWQGGSYELTPQMGPFRLVAIGRAFHWMDRTSVLAMLDQIIAPGGAIVLFHDAHPDVPENRWFKALREITDRYADGQDSHVAERKRGAHRRYEPYLFDSAFTVLDGLSVTTRSVICADEIVGRAYSLSTCAPDRLGARQSSFETDLRAAIAPYGVDGNFVEMAEMVALMARRPGQGA